jgi:hypothetical protein
MAMMADTEGKGGWLIVDEEGGTAVSGSKA